jgi:glutathione S-transferase
MKLYDFAPAPNPRRVRIFLAEKGINVPRLQIDLTKGEHRAPEFIERNPSGKIPVLELDDGTCIAESIAICRYFEALQPQPNLFGRSAVELARVDMRQRQLEFEMLGPIGISWRNRAIFSRTFGRVPDLAARQESDAAARIFYERLNRELANTPFIAGDRHTVADITGMVVIDFATTYVELKPDGGLDHLWRWHAAVAARPSQRLTTIAICRNHRSPNVIVMAVHGARRQITKEIVHAIHPAAVFRCIGLGNADANPANGRDGCVSIV